MLTESAKRAQEAREAKAAAEAERERTLAEHRRARRLEEQRGKSVAKQNKGARSENKGPVLKGKQVLSGGQRAAVSETGALIWE